MENDKLIICFPFNNTVYGVDASVAKIDILHAEKFEVLKRFVKGRSIYCVICLILVNRTKPPVFAKAVRDAVMFKIYYM
jgi:hypothetical protein